MLSTFPHFLNKYHQSPFSPVPQLCPPLQFPSSVLPSSSPELISPHMTRADGRQSATPWLVPVGSLVSRSRPVGCSRPAVAARARNSRGTARQTCPIRCRVLVPESLGQVQTLFCGSPGGLEELRSMVMLQSFRYSLGWDEHVSAWRALVDV